MNILVAGAISSVVPIVTIFYFALYWECNVSVNAAYLLLLSIYVTKIQMASFPFVCSLLSKLTPVENATFYQSCSFALGHFTVILSRVIAGATFERMPMMYICLYLTVNWLIEVIWFAIEYKKIKWSLK